MQWPGPHLLLAPPVGELALVVAGLNQLRDGLLTHHRAQAWLGAGLLAAAFTLAVCVVCLLVLWVRRPVSR